MKDPLLLVDGAKAAGEQGGLKPVQVGGTVVMGNRWTHVCIDV